MPLQEAILYGVRTPLSRPAGVGFGAPCRSRLADAKTWAGAATKLREQLGAGNAVGLLVQTRNGRPWDDTARNPTFNYQEDYLVAAYSIAPSLGAPWLPGRMIKDWITLFSLARAGMAQYQPTEGLEQYFQCSSAGYALSKGGMVKMVRFYEAQGKSREEAVDTQMLQMLMPPDKRTGNKTRYSAGWVGGHFTRTRPGIVRSFRMGNRPPNYQAPKPPQHG